MFSSKTARIIDQLVMILLGIGLLIGIPLATYHALTHPEQSLNAWK